VVPDLESGNMLAKRLEYLGEAQAAGIVLGARVPIVLTSRADSPATRLASCAVTLAFGRRGPRVLSRVLLVIDVGSSSVKFSVLLPS
jgi:Phosphate acetyl/butaryl transferase